MSKSSDGLTTNYLDNRWTATNAAALGATVNGSVAAPTNLTESLVIDTFSYSIRNQATGAHTCTISIRAASVAGTVLMSWDELPAAASSSVRHFNGLGLKAPKGQAIHWTMDSIIASVRATVNASGWITNSGSY